MRYLLLLFFLIPRNLQAQDLPAPPWPIVSDYGPRNHPSSTTYNWHWGIDYDGNIWDPVGAVEGGTIHTILRNTSSGGGGHVVGITGSRGYWFYLHLFTDAFPSISPDNRYELKQVRLMHPVSHELTDDPINIIIFWVDRVNNRAEKVLSALPGWWIPTGNPSAPYILSGSTWAHTQNTVAQGEIIARWGYPAASARMWISG